MSGLPLGRAPLVMLALFVFSATMILRRPAPPARQIEFWTFAQTHYDEYQARKAEFEKRHPGVTVRLQLMQGSILRDKLVAAFLSETAAPDLVEVEIGDVGRFFQGRPSDIGFADLTDRLQSEGWIQKMIAARFVPWSNRGRIYGVPHDLHPVVLFYRHDLFTKAGIDLPKEVETWEDFLKVMNRPGVLDSRRDGRRDRYGIMLAAHDATHFRPLLVQRGGDYFDAQGRVTFDSPLGVDTLAFLRDLIKQDHVVFRQPINWGPDMYGPMKEDRLLCAFTPDWFVGLIKKNAPELAGKWRGMPLPAWERGGRRTTTHGGTMIGLTRQAEQPDLAWELLKFYYFDRDALVTRYATTRIIPPLRAAWSGPVFSEPDPYTGGQRLGRLFVSLADDVPPVHQNKFYAEANTLLGPAVYAVFNQGADPARELKRVADELRRKQAKDRFAR